jgi:hypothetical protein
VRILDSGLDTIRRVDVIAAAVVVDGDVVKGQGDENLISDESTDESSNLRKRTKKLIL